jgi:hypothetical protein
VAKPAEVARDFHGPKLYQQRARVVLPILVRQARARHPLFYEGLAREVGMPNPRNLDYPLGCIGRTLNELGEAWRRDLPPIEALVVNRATGLPGPGLDGFLTSKGETWSNAAERRTAIERQWAGIYWFPYWSEVLEALGVREAPDPAGAIISQAGGQGGGEGPDHLALKLFVSQNPHLVGFVESKAAPSIEHDLPSGDCVDVVFANVRRIHAVEVKPARAARTDIARGLFQCVKYRAVLQALAGYENDSRAISVCLALGGPLPNVLIPLRNTLNIDVYENLSA